MTTQNSKDRLAGLMGYLVGKSGSGSPSLSQAIGDRLETMTEQEAESALQEILKRAPHQS